jgi:hypothetical protein
MGRPHSPQRRAPRFAYHVRLRHSLAASRLHAAGREHGGVDPATTPRYDHLTLADRRRAPPRPTTALAPRCPSGRSERRPNNLGPRFVQLSVTHLWHKSFRPMRPMCTQCGRNGRSGRWRTYLARLPKVEGLVDFTVRGGSSPLGAHGKALEMGTFQGPCGAFVSTYARV